MYNNGTMLSTCATNLDGLSTVLAQRYVAALKEKSAQFDQGSKFHSPYDSILHGIKRTFELS
ncbi:hypothetical protein Lalb_Chr10g0096221 [Lupinus albus]|uniref:Uncharacterized protein n=1 Tax=Lupinus albus TaxID=3870 RepID=A0A6A4PUG9_LUPAL|nr:hypothetical protein Lalb_Chr10g0096221 [Lupinus albus]